MNGYTFLLFTISYLSVIAVEPIPPDEDPGWKNDRGIIQTLEWHPSPSSQMGKRSFVLRNSETEKGLEPSPVQNARLLGTAHLSSRDSPSCLAFAYQTTGDNRKTKLTISINNKLLWRSRSRRDNGWTEIRLNISSSVGLSRSASVIVFDGQLASNDKDAQIQLENISIINAPCRSPNKTPSRRPSRAIKASPSRHIRSVSRSTKAVPGYDCNFEEDMCGWTQGPNATLDWIREQAASNTIAGIVGPNGDHTFGNATGFYLIAKLQLPVSTFDDSDVSALVSPRLPDNILGPMCAGWWYMMYGTEMTEFNVYLIVDDDFGTLTSIWRRFGNHGSHWQYGQIEIEPGKNITHVMFEVTAGWSIRLTVSLDDLQLIDGPCIKPDFHAIACNFEEEHICGYLSDPTGNLPWTRIQGSTPTLDTGASEDHTLGTKFGHFMYIETSSPQKPGDIARLISIFEPSADGRCLEFWYHQYGADIAKLNIYIEMNTSGSSNSSKTLVWSRGANVGNVWRKAHIATEYTEPFRVIFEGVVGKSVEGDISLDDVERLPISCKEPNNCDFEQDTFCGWENVEKTDNFDWEITRGTSDPNLLTGPISDHTTGSNTGAYAFINSRASRKENETAVLISQSMAGTDSNGTCLEFFYHMYGSGIGTLTIYLQQEGFTPVPMWTLFGEQEDGWLQGKVGFIVNSDHSILIEAKIVSPNEGDIALDDIVITSGYCTVEPSFAQPGFGLTTPTTQPTISTIGITFPPSLTTTTTSRSTVAPQSPWDCNFEQGVLCPTWTHDVSADFRWELKQGRTPSENTGPTVDHTLGTADGWYIYMEASYPNKYNERCRIISEEIQGMKCLQFWYHMYGIDIDTLNIYIQSNGQRGKPVWARSKNQGDQWLRGQYSISPANVNSKYQIVFEGIVGQFGVGDIGLDDIAIYTSCQQNADRLCTFEDPALCNYINDDKSQYNWTRTTGSDSSGGIFKPNVDHTEGTSNGAYMLIDLSRSSTTITDQRARLISPLMIPNNEQCVEFWYYANGNVLSSDSALSVFVRTQTQPSNSTGFLIWTKRTELDGQWRISQQRIPYGLSLAPYQLILEGSIYKNGSDSPAIAIDDVFIHDRACLNGGDCDFENGLCTWRNLFLFGNTSWIIGSGSAQPPYNGSLNDHTLGTETGQYLLLSSAFTNQESVVAVVQSETFPPTSTVGQCLTFWYFLRGNQLGSLNVNISTAQESVMIWTMGGIDHGDIWHFASVGFYVGQEYNIVIEGSVNALTQGYYAIDDIDIRDGYCGVIPNGANVTQLTTPQTVTRPTTAFQIPTIYDCNFEVDFCSWTHMNDAILNWTRNQGSTESYETGPLFDVTTQTDKGWYIYLETSSPAKLNDTARMKSPAIAASTMKCFQFWYHMNGPDINRLDILTIDFSNVETVVWTRKGSQGNVWRLGKVKLYNIPDMYSIIAQGVVGINFQGDIALDEFILVDGNCPSDFPFECDFDDPNLCGFTNDPTGQYNWTRHKGATPGTQNGPSFDHTTLTAQGYYMYITAASTSRLGQKGRLISPWMNNTNGQCLSFWYHSFGTDVGALTVYKLQSSTNEMFPMWRINDDFGDIWNAAEISIYKTDEPWAIVFEGEYGQGFFGDLAIDDVVIGNGQCSPLGSCTFETIDFCTWHNVRKSGEDEFDWLLGQGETDSAFTGPSVDHTFNDAFGYYAFIEASAPRQPNDRAILESTVLMPTSITGSCLSFWYHMYGNIGYLNVYINGTQSKEPIWIWTQNGNKSDIWLNGQVTIRSSAYYRLQIEGVIGPSSQGDTAIDDLRIFDNPCVLMPSNANPPEIPPTTISTQPPITSTTNTPSTGPLTTNTPNAGPSTTNTPSIGPSATNAPSTGPSTTNTPSIGPSATNAPSTGPSTTNTTSIGPSATNAPSTGPSTTNTPSIGPSATNAPSTGPSTTNTPSIGPSTTNAPSIGPSATNAPSTGPSTTNTPSIGPSTTNAPSTGPSTTNTPSIGPSTTNTPNIGPSATNTPSIGPSTTNAPSIGPSATNAPSTGPSTTNTPSIGPSTTNTPSIGPSATNAPSTGPSTTNTPSIGPSTTNAPSIGPSATNAPSTGPSTTNTPSIGPSTTNTPNIGPSATNTPSIGPSTTNAPSIGPSATNAPSTGPSTTNTPSTGPLTTNTPNAGPSTTNTPNIGPSATNTSSTGPLITTTTTRTTAVLTTTASSTPTPPDTTTRSMAIASYDSLLVLILLCAIIARLPFEE